MHGGVFDALIDDLAKTYRVHCLDLPGHGRSNAELTSAALEDLAAAVEPYVPTNAMVLGWSLGGLLALKLAQRLPLRALVTFKVIPAENGVGVSLPAAMTTCSMVMAEFQSEVPT